MQLPKIGRGAGGGAPYQGAQQSEQPSYQNQQQQHINNQSDTTTESAKLYTY